MRRVLPLVLGRFVPPWERHGKTADEFFGQISRSKNPIERLKRDQDREVLQEKEYEDYQNAAEASSQELLDNYTERGQRFREEEEKANNFLPYGATPEVIGKDGMAAWGRYESEIKAVGYSAQASQLLGMDFEVKLDWPDAAVASKAVDRVHASQPLWPYHGTVGVVLDIDGVVYRSKRMIEGSAEAIAQLKRLGIPFLFMTNGGGQTEESKAKELTKIIGVDITPEQCIMSHTPMQLMAAHYKEDTVLIGGPPSCVEVAKSYGFNKAIGILEYQRQHPELVPFKQWPPGVKPEAPNSVPYPEIAAVFCFTDTLDAFNDAQIIVDLVTSPHGQVGSAVSGDQTIPIYFSADDLLWSTNAPLPRFGMGAFREMLCASYRCVVGSELQIVQYGKPRTIAYKFAQKRLKKLSKDLGWNPEALRCIAMVGDNLETDIVGANAAGGPWLSVHVLSGIGSAPAAMRTTCLGDEEAEWIDDDVEKSPHYVAPSLEHFARELLRLPESHILLQKKASYIRPSPASLKDTYNFKPW